MSYRITARMTELLAEVHTLGDRVESWLTVASSATREEWVKLRARIPPFDEQDSGYLPVSEAELEEMKMKMVRCAEILRGLRIAAAHVPPPADDDKDDCDDDDASANVH